MAVVPCRTTAVARSFMPAPSACPTIVAMPTPAPSLMREVMLNILSPMPYADNATVALGTRPMMPVRTMNPKDVPDAPIDAGRPMRRMRLTQAISGRRSRQVTLSSSSPGHEDPQRDAGRQDLTQRSVARAAPATPMRDERTPSEDHEWVQDDVQTDGDRIDDHRRHGISVGIHDLRVQWPTRRWRACR